MRRMRIVLRGDCLQLTLQPEERRNSRQGQRLVSVLRAFVPRDDGEAACDMGSSHRALGLVLMLAAGAAGAEGFEADILDRQRLGSSGSAGSSNTPINQFFRL
jgi:hypothetical protein